MDRDIDIDRDILDVDPIFPDVISGYLDFLNIISGLPSPKRESQVAAVSPLRTKP